MENIMMFGALPFDTLNELTDALSEPNVFLANTDEDDIDSLNNAITRSIEFALARHELKPRFPSIEAAVKFLDGFIPTTDIRSEEHTSELQSRPHLVCRLLLEKKKK